MSTLPLQLSELEQQIASAVSSQVSEAIAGRAEEEEQRRREAIEAEQWLRDDEERRRRAGEAQRQEKAKKARVLQLTKRVAFRMRSGLLHAVFSSWAALAMGAAQSRREAEAGQREAEAASRAAEAARQQTEAQRAAQQASFLSQLDDVGSAWFDAMCSRSELTRGGPKGLIRQISEKAGVTMEDEEGGEYLGSRDFLR